MHAETYHPEGGEYSLWLRSCYQLRTKDEGQSHNLEPIVLGFSGVVERHDDGPAWTRPLGWIRVDSVYDENDRRITRSGYKPVFDPFELDSGSADYLTSKHLRRFPAAGEHRRFNKYPFNAHRFEGALVLHEVAKTESRTLPIEDSYRDRAMSCITDGVYVGVSDYEQDSGVFRVTLKSWESRLLTSKRNGQKRLVMPLLPFDFDPSKRIEPEIEAGLLGSWEAAVLSLPDLVRFDFLDRNGDLVYSSEVNGLYAGYETGSLLTSKVEFAVPEGREVVVVRPLVITEERVIEIPFSLGRDDIDRFIVKDE
ncbi:MAG: hypothetical protein Phyf2KO_27200 [Phycisphaerales bacterium]